MPTTGEEKDFAQRSTTVFHPISAGDKTAMAAMRAIVEPCASPKRRTPAE